MLPSDPPSAAVFSLPGGANLLSESNFNRLSNTAASNSLPSSNQNSNVSFIPNAFVTPQQTQVQVGGGGTSGNVVAGVGIGPRYKFKTELCRNFEQIGSCSYRQCTFAHGLEELRHYTALAQQQQAQANAQQAAAGGGGGSSVGSGSNPSNPNSQARFVLTDGNSAPNFNTANNALNYSSGAFSSGSAGENQQQQPTFGSSSGSRLGNSPPLASTTTIAPLVASSSSTTTVLGVGGASSLSATAASFTSSQLNQSSAATTATTLLLGGTQPPPNRPATILSNIDRLLGDLTFEVKREQDAFTRLLEQNRGLEKDLQTFQQEHQKEKQVLTSLKERHAALRAQLETVPLPSFMNKN